ncbi:MAG: permease [Litorilinea sp.]
MISDQPEPSSTRTPRAAEPSYHVGMNLGTRADALTGTVTGTVTGTGPLIRPRPSRQSQLLRWGLSALLLGVALVVVFGDVLSTGGGRLLLWQRVQTFVTIFLGIFIEAVPFLVAGSMVSGFIAVFVDQTTIERFIPRRALPASIAGALLGIVFPVCECGVVPVTRRLYEKGLPMSVGISFLLAAPVINIIVFASTQAAFGFGVIFWGRIIITFVVAALVGLVFHLAKPHQILLPKISAAHAAACDHTLPRPSPTGPQPTTGQRSRRALTTAGDDFIDMVRYLILGCLLAAGMQTLVSQSALLTIGQGPIISVVALQLLAFVLSVCSTVDAFLALAFSATFTTGSLLAFLTFGPMVDIKSALMFLSVLQRRVVFYLILLPFTMIMLIGIVWNLYVGI